MSTHDRHDHRDDDLRGVERRLRLWLRGVTVAVILALLIFRVVILPFFQFTSGVEIEDDGYVLGALIGALLLMLGIEAPAYLSGLGKRNGSN